MNSLACSEGKRKSQKYPKGGIMFYFHVVDLCVNNWSVSYFKLNRHTLDLYAICPLWVWNYFKAECDFYPYQIFEKNK